MRDFEGASSVAGTEALVTLVDEGDFAVTGDLLRASAGEPLNVEVNW